MKARNSVQVTTTPTATPTASTVENPYASLLTINTVPPPCRKSTVSYYMHKYYGSRVRCEYDQVYAESCKVWHEASEEERHALGMKEPAPVAVRKAVTAQVMERESAEFMASLLVENDCDFDARMETWLAEKTVPTTPQQYHK